MLRLRILLVCTAQAYGPNQPVLEMMASARFHGGGKGNVSLETDSMLLTATGSPSLDFRFMKKEQIITPSSRIGKLCIGYPGGDIIFMIG
jgi:hypothetical protein